MMHIILEFGFSLTQPQKLNLGKGTARVYKCYFGHISSR